MAELSTAADLLEAIRLAEQAFGAANANRTEYRLVHAQRILTGAESCTGTACWKLTFKAADLIPSDPSGRLGAGGELYFTVDLDKGQATLNGRGE